LWLREATSDCRGTLELNGTTKGPVLLGPDVTIFGCWTNCSNSAHQRYPKSLSCIQLRSLKKQPESTGGR
jgi:hypothetical protein